jgi:hypothetical protein
MDNEATTGNSNFNTAPVGGQVVNLCETGDQWQDPLQEWTDQWSNAINDEQRADSETRQNVVARETAVVVRRQLRNNSGRHSPVLDLQCGICTNHCTTVNCPATHNDVCKHRMCQVCCLMWMSTASFDSAGRAGEIERIVKSGRCPACRGVQGTWRRENDDNPVSRSRGGIILGFWERNSLLGSDVATQIQEVAIANVQEWNSLVVHHAMGRTLQVLPILEASTEQHNSILLQFFVGQVERGNTNSHGNFTCSTCQRKVHVSKVCRKDNCPTGCSFKEACFDCALACTKATKEGNGEIAARRINQLGETNSNRNDPCTVVIGNLKFRCEDCKKRGICRRLDRQVLDCETGFCANMARVCIATALAGETQADP